MMVFQNRDGLVGSLYTESTGDATEAESECADDDNTGNKTKKTTAAAVAKPRIALIVVLITIFFVIASRLRLFF
jgi:hypothetical protein